MQQTPIGIRKLLEEPFGPYPEGDVLSDVFRAGSVLNLISVSMECAGSPIGFVSPAQTRMFDRNNKPLVQF